MAGAVSLKKPHHIATLLFSEVVNDHPNSPFDTIAWLRLSTTIYKVEVGKADETTKISSILCCTYFEPIHWFC